MLNVWDSLPLALVATGSRCTAREGVAVPTELVLFFPELRRSLIRELMPPGQRGVVRALLFLAVPDGAWIWSFPGTSPNILLVFRAYCHLRAGKAPSYRQRAPLIAMKGWPHGAWRSQGGISTLTSQAGL